VKNEDDKMVAYADIMTAAAAKANDITKTYGNMDAIMKNTAVLSGLANGKSLDCHDAAMAKVSLAYAELIANPSLIESYIDLVNAVAFAAQYAPDDTDLEFNIQKIAQNFGAAAAQAQLGATSGSE
jgi:hypothetical protein